MKRQPKNSRETLAERAALLRLACDDTRLLYPALRRLTTAELLARPAGRGAGCELNGEIESLCTAALCAVRRRGGWLNLRISAAPLYTGVCGRQLHAAILCFLRDALCSNTVASITCRKIDGAALLLLRSGGKPNGTETIALLRHLAQQNGGTALFAATGAFSAAVRMPLLLGAQGSALSAAQGIEELVTDRYSLLYVYLYRFCAWPDE